MRRWPEDVVRIANEVLAEIDDQQEVEYRLQSIMAAVLAERQRCADVADKYATNDVHSGDVRLCAAYIRREIQYPAGA